MSIAKYFELRDAAARHVAVWDRYEKDCEEFIRNFRAALVTYLDSPEKKVLWIHFEENYEDADAALLKTTLTRRMQLYDDAFWRFMLRIDFENTWVTIYFKVKKDGNFMLEMGNEKLTIRQGNQQDMQKAVERTYNLVLEFFETEFDRFIHGKPSTLGFKTATQ